MHLRELWAFALAGSLVNAFKDTSPLFLFSTSEFLASSPSLVSADQLRNVLTPQLTKCISDTYVIVSQPGVEAADFHDEFSAPQLRQKVLGEDASIRSSLSVTDVLGAISADGLSEIIQESCGARHLRIDASILAGTFTIAEDAKPRVINLDFPALPSDGRRSQRLLEHDAFLTSMLDMIASSNYTVVYTTSPPGVTRDHEQTDSKAYEMDSQTQAHLYIELKRDLSHQKRATSGNITLPDGPLFERYQYFNPGLFMGLLVAFILVTILYVGISGIGSLQVSYAAFDKEMGPSTQKNKAG